MTSLVMAATLSGNTTVVLFEPRMAQTVSRRSQALITTDNGHDRLGALN
jgi:hypothetical protein